MPNNFLITGPPGSGKTSVLERTISILRGRGLVAGGVFCPEMRKDGIRVGFVMIDIITGEKKILAHVNKKDGPRVGKYCVDVKNVDELSESAIGRALRESDFLAIDEIAPMELHSEGFRRTVRSALESSKPLLAVIHERSSAGFVDEVKSRPDVKIFHVEVSTREELPERLAEEVLRSLKTGTRL
jgi:nucleoside-triphosphatase